MNKFCIIIRRVDADRYQAHLRTGLTGNALFYSRRVSRASAAKREVERLFGPLEWKEAPDNVRAKEPEISQVAYFEWGNDVVSAGRKGGLARRDNLTAEERSVACRKAVLARWEREKSKS